MGQGGADSNSNRIMLPGKGAGGKRSQRTDIGTKATETELCCLLRVLEVMEGNRPTATEFCSLATVLEGMEGNIIMLPGEGASSDGR